MSCDTTHSQARELLREGYQAALVAATLMIIRSSLYYRPRARRSRADHEQIIAANGEKPTFGYPGKYALYIEHAISNKR